MSGRGELAWLDGDTGTLFAGLGADARGEVNDVDVPAAWRSVEHHSAAVVQTAVTLEVGEGAAAGSGGKLHRALPRVIPFDRAPPGSERYREFPA
jgi:hypothetical protein